MSINQNRNGNEISEKKAKPGRAAQSSVDWNQSCGLEGIKKAFGISAAARDFSLRKLWHWKSLGSKFLFFHFVYFFAGARIFIERQVTRSVAITWNITKRACVSMTPTIGDFASKTGPIVHSPTVPTISDRQSMTSGKLQIEFHHISIQISRWVLYIFYWAIVSWKSPNLILAALFQYRTPLSGWSLLR